MEVLVAQLVRQRQPAVEPRWIHATSDDRQYGHSSVRECRVVWQQGAGLVKPAGLAQRSSRRTLDAVSGYPTSPFARSTAMPALAP